MTPAHWWLYLSLGGAAIYLLAGVVYFRIEQRRMCVADISFDEAEQAAGGETPPDTGGTTADPRVLAQIADYEADVTHLEREIDEKAEELKKLKADREAAVGLLRRFIREANAELPLWAKESRPAAQWQNTPLADVLTGLPSKKVETLAEASLVTLGDLTKFQEAKGTGDWGLKGIGPEWRTKIENAVVDWFAKHPVAGPVTEEAVADGVETSGAAAAH